MTTMDMAGRARGLRRTRSRSRRSPGVRQPTGEMPPYTKKVVTDQELADIYAYLQSIPQPPPAKSIPILNK
jgi:mono/diheme cytochrome c family protein